MLSGAGDGGIHVNRNALAALQHHGAQVIHAMGLVGMFVREEHRVDVVDLGID